MFEYPEFDANGVKVLTQIGGKNAEMLMDITCYRLSAGKSVSFFSAEKEIALLLLGGEVKFAADGISESATRTDLFDDMPTCLHCARGCKIDVSVLSDCEFLYISTLNERDFATKLYRKSDVDRTVSCEGLWENVAVRDVNTIFDYSNAPYSNLVVGEVLARQGRWWSYVPHSHPQPEAYYYRFNRPEGFGACFIDDVAYTVKDGSLGCFEGGKTHVQVTAPCYPEYCCWMIRHLDGNPWQKTREVKAEYAWIEGGINFAKKD